MKRERLSELEPKQELPKDVRLVSEKEEDERGDCPSRVCEPVK